MERLLVSIMRGKTCSDQRRFAEIVSTVNIGSTGYEGIHNLLSRKTCSYVERGMPLVVDDNVNINCGGGRSVGVSQWFRCNLT